MKIKIKHWIYLLLFGLFISGIIGAFVLKKYNYRPYNRLKRYVQSYSFGQKKDRRANNRKQKHVLNPNFGQKKDSLNGVYVYSNASPTKNIKRRHIAENGYNFGLKYQCVEFVKRYYYEHLGHEMPYSYGDAKDFFEKSIGDGGKNKARNLTQYTNPSKTKPEVNDLVVFHSGKHGHVAIVSKVEKDKIEIIQQNSSNSRRILQLENKNNKWKIKNNFIVGWLRKE